MESDSLQLINAITGISTISEIFGPLSDITSFIPLFEVVNFCFIIPIELNVVADSLAKKALNAFAVNA